MQPYYPPGKKYFYANLQHAPSITSRQVSAYLSPRPHDSHKGNFGTAAIIGGAPGMIGAAILAGRAALKLGAGAVHIGMLAENTMSVDVNQPELMIHSAHTILHLPRLSVLAIGCGMGNGETAQQILQDVLHLNSVLVIDADGLNILSLRPDLRTLLISRNQDCVLTPHPGEAARLLGCSTEDANFTPGIRKELSRIYRSAVVLKGAESPCVTHAGTAYVNKTGNPV